MCTVCVCVEYTAQVRHGGVPVSVLAENGGGNVCRGTGVCRWREAACL